jgi:hypothetical protein
MDHNDLTVEDGLALKLEGPGDGREPFGPVVAVAGEYPGGTLVNVDLSR